MNLKNRFVLIIVLVALLLAGCSWTANVEMRNMFVLPAPNNPTQLITMARVEGTIYTFALRNNIVKDGCYRMTYGAQVTPGIDGWADYVGEECPK